MLLNIKSDSLVNTVSRLRKISLEILGLFSSSLYKLSMQTSMVSSNGMLVNKESTSRLVIFKLGSCLQISSAKSNEYVTVYSFWVNGIKNGSKKHHYFCNHSSNFDDFSILVSNSNDFKVNLIESFFRQRPPPFQ